MASIPRLGIDSNIGLPFLSTIHQLGGANLSTWPGLKWQGAEPSPGSYGDVSPLITAREACHALGREFYLHFLVDHTTFLNGTKPNWTSVKTERHQNLTDVITHIITEAQPDILQIDNEPDNKWTLSAVAGFAEAHRIIYDAAKAVDPDMPVGGGAVNFGNRFQGAATPFTDGQTWTHNFIDEIDGKTDFYVVNAHHLVEYIPPMVAWVRSELDLFGLQAVPIWSGDTMTAPKYQLPWSDVDDVDQFDLMLAGDPDAIEWFAVRQASYLVMKLATLFGAGCERVFISTDENWLSYAGPDADFRRTGLLNDDGTKKPAFYSAQQLIAEIDGFERAEVISDTVIKFTSSRKLPVIVAWNPSGSTTVDLTSVWQRAKVRVKTAVTTLDGSSRPVLTPEAVVSSNAVPISTVPVFVSADVGFRAGR